MFKPKNSALLCVGLTGLLLLAPIASHAAAPVSPKPAPVNVTVAKPVKPAAKTTKITRLPKKPSTTKPVAKVAAAKPVPAKPQAKPVSVPAAKTVTQAPSTTPKATTTANTTKTEPAPVATFTKPGEITRQVELDGYRCMLPAMFGAPQHEVMPIPADEQKSRMINLSMYSFTTAASDKAFMSSFNEADITDMPTEKIKSILESSKASYIKEIPDPQELSSAFTTFQGHQAIVFDVKETTKSGSVFYSKVMGLLKPGGYYQFAFVSHDQADLAQPWVQQVFDSIRFVK